MVTKTVQLANFGITARKMLNRQPWIMLTAEDLASKGCEIDCVMKVTVNPLNYMGNLYYTLILKTLSTVQQVICEGCNGKLSSDDVAHWGKNGCMAKNRNVLKDF